MTMAIKPTIFELPAELQKNKELERLKEKDQEQAREKEREAKLRSGKKNAEVQYRS